MKEDTYSHEFKQEFIEGSQRLEESNQNRLLQSGPTISIPISTSTSRNLSEFFVSDGEVKNFRMKMKLFLENYIKVVADTIPKQVMRSLVTEIKEELCEIYLSAKIFDDEEKFMSLREDEDKANKRRTTESKVKMLKKGIEIIDRETTGMAFDDDDA